MGMQTVQKNGGLLIILTPQLAELASEEKEGLFQLGKTNSAPQLSEEA